MMKLVTNFVFLLAFAPYVFADGDGEDPWKKYWIAHGVCASIAWTILVPIAIGSSMLRKQFSSGEGATLWFQIHRSLNTLAAMLTIVSFGIAVHIIRAEDGKSNWKEQTHFTVGLVIFIVTLLQAISGMIRPPLPKKVKPEATVVKDLEDSEEAADEEDQPKNAGVDIDKPAAAAVEEKKSLLRRMWEYHHRFFGLGLLATAWWQIHSGWELMVSEVGGEDVAGNAFLGVAGGISGVIVLLYVFQEVRTKKD
jgi:hypothetical protein